ncbi:hypothetical protein D9756_000687 [Leucocoprinus leucothites]|uniref:4'-phosphopantetheinyl transferase domain-containing protein n=1 Tax=Leucocoprinus leucothites TaxID=201217 RepID=A0A8H5GF14_9AGAR|nr:hypothetical protein D9756_000687 [Leucoagaricus leucothites]
MPNIVRASAIGHLMLFGIGVDIVHLPRIAAIVKRHASHKFARRILSAKELEQWSCLQGADDPKQVRFLAVRWAVKEAVYKALYPTIKPTWKELTFLGLSPSGEKPTVSFVSPTQDVNQKIGPIHVSVSHDSDYAVAYVAVEQFCEDDLSLETQTTGLERGSANRLC